MNMPLPSMPSQSIYSLRMQSGYSTHIFARADGFTLLEVLVALVIIGTAFAASLRAISSLTQNSGDLRASMMATWSAENRLSQIRLAQEWPPLGTRSFDCPQAELSLRCDETIYSTPNPSFRRVEVAVIDNRDTSRKLITLSQIVPNAL
ncbi:MAG: type secretion system protein GspI [Pseudomonadota bacterium]|jgi:general secretion pathway protein I